MRVLSLASVALRRLIAKSASAWPHVLLQTRSETEKFGRVVARIPVEIAGRRVLIPAANTFHLKRFRDLASGTKEPGTRAWIEETLAPGDVFLDIGANVGIFSVLAAIVAPGAKIYACEPESQSAAALIETVWLNQLPVTVFVQAIGQKLSADVFHISEKLAPGFSDHQLFSPIHHDGKPFTPVATIGSIVVSVDEMVRLGAIETPTHIKIDVDGREPDVLNGARAVLPSVKWVGVESVKGHGDRTRDLLAELGFIEEPRYCGQSMIIARPG